MCGVPRSPRQRKQKPQPERRRGQRGYDTLGQRIRRSSLWRPRPGSIIRVYFALPLFQRETLAATLSVVHVTLERAAAATFVRYGRDSILVEVALYRTGYRIASFYAIFGRYS